MHLRALRRFKVNRAGREAKAARGARHMRDDVRSTRSRFGVDLRSSRGPSAAEAWLDPKSESARKRHGVDLGSIGDGAGVDLGRPGSLGVDQESIGSRVGVGLGRSGVDVRSIRGQSAVNLRSINGRSGINPRCTWGHSGATCGPIRNQSEVNVVPVQGPGSMQGRSDFSVDLEST